MAAAADGRQHGERQRQRPRELRAQLEADRDPGRLRSGRPTPRRRRPLAACTMPASEAMIRPVWMYPVRASADTTSIQRGPAVAVV